MCAVCVCLFVCMNMELKINNDDEDDGKVIMQPKHSNTSRRLDQPAANERNWTQLSDRTLYSAALERKGTEWKITGLHMRSGWMDRQMDGQTVKW